MMNKKKRNILISIFVALWLGLFFYESTRHFFLNQMSRRVLKRDLPKVKMLFPPAGWIMFYRVDPQTGYVQVYGVRDGKWEVVDPHTIIETRTVGFDNIHRGILGAFLRKRYEACRFLVRKFPFYDKFVLTQVYYPDVGADPSNRLEKVVYQCTP